MEVLAVGLGGFLGAIARYGLSGLAQRSADRFPLGTLAVNVLGCLVLGAFMALVEDRQLFAPATRLFVGVGVLGAFTTFSTFGYETVALLRDGAVAPACLSVAGNLVLGVLAVLAGAALARGLP